MAECHPVAFQWVDGGEGAGHEGLPRRSPLHAHERARRSATSRSGPAATSHSSAESSTTSSSTSAGSDEYVIAYTNAATIIGEDFADTEDLDGLFSGFDPETGSYDTASWQYEGMEGQAAAGQREAGTHGRAGARRPRRPAPWRRAARGRSHPPASALRLPAAEASTTAATRRRWSRRRAASRRSLPGGRRGALCELRPRAHVGVRLLGRLDPAHRGRPVHPHGGDHPAPARQHGAARRRHPRASRTRLDPGLDRYPDALQHPAGLPADAACLTGTRTARSTSS